MILKNLLVPAFRCFSCGAKYYDIEGILSDSDKIELKNGESVRIDCSKCSNIAFYCKNVYEQNIITHHIDIEHNEMNKLPYSYSIGHLGERLIFNLEIKSLEKDLGEYHFIKKFHLDEMYDEMNELFRGIEYIRAYSKYRHSFMDKVRIELNLDFFKLNKSIWIPIFRKEILKYLKNHPEASITPNTSKQSYFEIIYSNHEKVISSD